MKKVNNYIVFTKYGYFIKSLILLIKITSFMY